MLKVTIYGNELYHYGVKGQSWGNRQYQNEDGSLTPLGREHYGYGEARKKVDSLKNKVNNYKSELKKHAMFTSGRKEVSSKLNSAKKEYKNAIRSYRKTDGYKNKKILMKQIDKDRKDLIKELDEKYDISTKAAAADNEQRVNESTAKLLNSIFGTDYDSLNISNKFQQNYESAISERNKEVAIKLVKKYGTDAVADNLKYLSAGEKVASSLLLAGFGGLTLAMIKNSNLSY